MVSKVIMRLPDGARNIEIADHCIMMDIDDLPDPNTPPLPAPMPSDEIFPDWRWRRLITAEHVVKESGVILTDTSSADTGLICASSTDANETDRSLADDEWLGKVILPCRLFQLGKVHRPGHPQKAYDAAFALYQQGETTAPMLSTPARQAEAGILNGWTPEALEAKLGMGYSAESYRVYEALFFDVRARRGDRAWLREAVFRPLASLAGGGNRMRYMRAALHLERREFEAVIDYPNPPSDRRWLAMMPLAYQRLHYQMLREELFLAALKRLKTPARDIADLRTEWAMTPPPDNEETEAWLHLLPRRTWKRFTVQTQALAAERQLASLSPGLGEGLFSGLFGLPPPYQDMVRERLAELISQPGAPPSSPKHPTATVNQTPQLEVTAIPQTRRNRDTRILSRQASERSEEVDAARNRYAAIRRQLDQWMRGGMTHSDDDAPGRSCGRGGSGHDVERNTTSTSSL